MDDKKRLILVNRTHSIPSDWSDHLRLVSFQYKEELFFLEQETYNAFEGLRKKMLEKRLILGVASAYRSSEEQKKLYEEMARDYGPEKAKTLCALPGHSEHETGLAVDIEMAMEASETQEELNYPSGYFYRCVHEHLSEYGFILRYPEGKEQITEYSFEPWHIRYVGNPHATIIMKQNLALEEYLEEQKQFLQI